MGVLNILLADLSPSWRVDEVHIGANWVLAVMSRGGETCVGMASAPRTDDAVSDRFHAGVNILHGDAPSIARLALSKNPVEASVGMATLNGLLQPDEDMLSDIDAADWLVSSGGGKRVAVFGRFPFVAEDLEAVAAKVWVFERDPQPGEYDAADMGTILPQAEIVAITSSALINHTLDDILTHIASDSAVMLLGPSTPLSSRLFPLGIDVLSGVQVTDIAAAAAGVGAGLSFRHMEGMRRVTMCNQECED